MTTPTESGRRSRFTRRTALTAGVALLLVAVLVGVVVNRVAANRDRASSVGTSADPADLLSVTRVDTNFGDACNDQKGWAFPQTIDTLPFVTHVDDPDWVARYGGVPVSGNYYAFTLTALTSSNVVITDIEATAVSQAPPLQGVYPPPWAAGCSGVVPSTFALNLDDSPVSVVATPGDGMSGPGQVIALPHRIDRNQPEVWHLTPMTQDCLCEWVATVHWTVGNQAFHTTIDDDGTPFPVTATSAATMIDNEEGQLDHWQVTTLGG